MNLVCKICAKSFENDTSLHHHLKAHKIRQTEYYQTYFPRKDRYTGLIIKYKNKEQYFSADFNSKASLKGWLLSISPELAKDYIKNILVKRKEKGKLKYAPTQVELKTMMMPGIKYITEQFGSYSNLCKEIGLEIRFSLNKLDEKQFKDVSKKFIFTDSREQKALEFDNRTRVQGMSFGDYRMKGSSVYIERKSVGDAWGTLTGGYERFEREIIRAKEANGYLVILVESSFSSLEKFPLQRQVAGKIKIPVEFLYHNIRDLMQKYTHIQFLFVNDREESSRVIQKLFSADEQVKDVDLQLLYDLGKL
tara:strand:- start:1686 stop:2606 length:921 start_codon:yes stop_codon:yes gene_type:complete